MTTQDVVTHYHTDAVGCVRMITDAAGQVVARYDYLPFGEPCGPACGPTPPLDARQFAGKEKDTETGFDYFGTRYLQSLTRRRLRVSTWGTVYDAVAHVP